MSTVRHALSPEDRVTLKRHPVSVGRHGFFESHRLTGYGHLPRGMAATSTAIWLGRRSCCRVLVSVALTDAWGPARGGHDRCADPDRRIGDLAGRARG